MTSAEVWRHVVYSRFALLRTCRCARYIPIYRVQVSACENKAVAVQRIYTGKCTCWVLAARPCSAGTRSHMMHVLLQMAGIGRVAFFKEGKLLTNVQEKSTNASTFFRARGTHQRAVQQQQALWGGLHSLDSQHLHCVLWIQADDAHLHITNS